MPSATAQRPADALLEVRDVHLWRGEHHLLRGISFAVSAGQLLQLNGPNGVGKTSLLRVIAHLLPAESGQLLWKGAPAKSAYLQDLLYLGHSNALKLDLTAVENLRFSAGLQHGVSGAQCQAALRTLAIPHCGDLPARVLSAGQAGIALVESLMARHLDQGGMIVAAAHQALLAGHAGARSVQLN
jgi:heme exporter protein A